MIRPGIRVNVSLCRDPAQYVQADRWALPAGSGSDGLEPVDDGMFVFTNRQHDKVKLLCWQRYGFGVWQKRLQRECCQWLDKIEGGRISLAGQEVNWLLDGNNIAAMRPQEVLHF